MAVDTFWRRMPERTISGLRPRQLQDLVPHWLTEAFERDYRAGRLVAVEDCGALMDKLLLLGAADGPHSGVAKWLAAGPPDWDDVHLVGTRGPEFVAQVAEFLGAAPIDEWADRFRGELAGYADHLGYGRLYDDGWHGMVREGVHELRMLFATAAEQGEAVIEKISA